MRLAGAECRQRSTIFQCGTPRGRWCGREHGSLFPGDGQSGSVPQPIPSDHSLPGSQVHILDGKDGSMLRSILHTKLNEHLLCHGINRDTKYN